MLSIAIQAGGLSLRMGEDKALLPLGGRPLIEHVLEQVSGLSEDIVITTNRPEALSYLHTRLVSDPIPGQGALLGLQTALAATRGDRVLVLACDMPFVQKEFVTYLISLDPSGDIVIPRHDGHYEPMHAIYRRTRCLRAIEEALAAGEKKLTSFFVDLQLVTIDENTIESFDPKKWSFFNVNTPEDLQAAEQIYALIQASSSG